MARSNGGLKRVQLQVALKLSGAAHVASGDAEISCGSSPAVKSTEMPRSVIWFTCFSSRFSAKVYIFVPGRRQKVALILQIAKIVTPKSLNTFFAQAINAKWCIHTHMQICASFTNAKLMALLCCALSGAHMEKLVK